MVRAGRS